MDEAVRISYTETWTSANAQEEGDLALTQNGNAAAVINWANTSDWTTSTENGTTYKYYNYKLAPQETTSQLLSSVTFNSAITNDENCVTSNNGQTIECTSTGNGYDGATYKLTFHIETVQYDKYEEAWGTEVEIAEEKVLELFAHYIVRNSNSSAITNYTNGVTTEAYTFSHAATDQTGALTDYRYIGNNPYNYVYFNCTNLNNQNSSTCELWRVIGVFDVEREIPDPEHDGETLTISEQRVKLIRGNSFENGISYSSNNSVNWDDTSLKTFLNGDYYNSTGTAASYGLNASARSFIEEAKYYLGGRGFQGESAYGTTEEIYTWERGISVYTGSDANWIGSVALAYPSDNFYLYGDGVDGDCYNNPMQCENNGAVLGWMYNSNVRENNNSIATTWFLSVGLNGIPYMVSSSGQMNSSGSSSTFSVRPVVYLSASVKILSGTGQSTDPYKLSL